MTAAGPAEAARAELIDAINQVFTLFRLNYHNQYLKAFGNTDELNEVKRLWLEMLRGYAPSTVLKAARAVMESSEYLPTLRTMLLHCERSAGEPSLPDAHSAYLEACRAPQPKAGHAWSHPLVYHAGRASDWYFLQGAPEAKGFAVFKLHYEALRRDLERGVKLPDPSPANAPPALEEKPLPKLEQTERLQQLKRQLDL